MEEEIQEQPKEYAKKNEQFYEVQEDPKMVERALLVGVCEPGTTPEVAQEHLEELAQLVDTMGVPVVGDLIARISRPNPRFYVGTGKADEIKVFAEHLEADVIIFDLGLSPAQQRNWEKHTGLCVIDREEVILDIFAGRAQTREAVLQVALARMEYHLPRLRRAWTHLERQRGGTSNRGGMGELQLEVDRRLVVNRIAKIKKELAEVRKRRVTQRKSRGLRPVPTAAIVGYTNAGKSSLLRRLTGADVLVEDKLFATLDTTTRRIVLENNQPLLLTDTVGFIRKLPHDLVEAFKATLEEAVEADFLVHVLDVSHPEAEDHYNVTCQVLDELGMGDKKTLLVLNKIDLLEDPYPLVRMRAKNPLCTAISVHSGEGIEAMLALMNEHFVLDQLSHRYRIPANRYDLVTLLHREANIESEHYEGNDIVIEATLPPTIAAKVAEFVIEE